MGSRHAGPRADGQVTESLRPYAGVALIFATFLAIIAASSIALFALRLGLSPASISAYYRGSEAAFISPKSPTGLLKVAVPHLLAMPLALFTAIHLVGYLGLARRRPFALLAWLAFAAALTNVLSGLGVRFLWPGLAVVKWLSFLGLEALLLIWTGLWVMAFLPALRRTKSRTGIGGASVP